MRCFFLDASVLAKRYSHEDGSDLVNEMMRRVDASDLICALIGVLELISILLRKRNDGRLSQEAFELAMANFRDEVIDSDSFVTLSISDTQMFGAIALIEKHNLNATDALLLRAALDLAPKFNSTEDQFVLWTSDMRLARAAESESLSVFNPETESPYRLQELLPSSSEEE